MSALAPVLRTVDRQFDEMKHALVELARIPGVSAPGFPPAEVRRSADAFAALPRRAGLENVEVLELPGVHPYVYGDWLKRKGAPTVVLYGHHDVVPPGRTERWRTPPFEPVERKGRVYGRGTADDKGGILVHVAAVAAYLRATGALPCNVKFLVEGEEEIGSENLGAFLRQQARRMTGDAVVLSDTANFDTGVPGLTYRLRGLCVVDVEVRCLERPVHSGQRGGLVPDAVQILCGLIARLGRADGRLNVPGLYRRVKTTAARQRARLRRLPFDARRIGRQVGLLPGVRLTGEKGFSAYETIWTRPALTVIAFEAQPLQGSSNQVLDSARARISMRTVPDMDSRGAAAARAADAHAAAAAAVEPLGPAFEAARRALARGFGREPALMGAGGSIGFVQPFADFLKGAPCLLTGVEDPLCGAHSENESLHLGDWRKCMKSAVYLYDELSRLERRS